MSDLDVQGRREQWRWHIIGGLSSWEPPGFEQNRFRDLLHDANSQMRAQAIRVTAQRGWGFLLPELMRLLDDEIELPPISWGHCRESGVGGDRAVASPWPDAVNVAHHEKRMGDIVRLFKLKKICHLPRLHPITSPPWDFLAPLLFSRKLTRRATGTSHLGEGLGLGSFSSTPQPSPPLQPSPNRHDSPKTY